MYYEDEVEVDRYEESIEVINKAFTILQEDIPMYTETEQQRSYLKNRLYSIFDEKDHALGRKYGVEDDERPKNWGDLVDRIAKGRYVLPREDKDTPFVYHSLIDINYIIQWRDPALKADKEGYKIAKTKMKEVKQAALDKISILDPKEGLNVLNEFEKTEFH